MAVCVTALMLVPLGYIVYITIDIGAVDAYRLIVRPRVGELLRGTVILVGITVPVSVVLAVGAAWLVERTSIPGAKWLGPLLVAPLAVPAFVSGYAWVTFIPSLRGLDGALLITVGAYYPLVYLPVAATLRRLDPALEESARALGLSPVAVFFRVILPQLRLAILGGALLVALHLLAEYGAFVFVGYDTFTTAIFDQYRSTFNGSAGSMLAGVLVLCCLFLLTAEAAGRGNSRFARIGSGSPRPPTRISLRYFTVPALAFVGAIIVPALVVPVFIIGRWLVRGGTDIWDGAIAATFGQTALFGLYGACAAVVLAFPVAWLSIRYPSGSSKLVEGIQYICSSLPGIVVALGFITVTIRFAPPIYQTTGIVIAAYVVLFVPRALVSLRAGLAQVPVELEEAAKSLGVPMRWAFTRVTLRLAAPSIAAGGALVFLAVITELTATLLLAPTGTVTLATKFWSLSSSIDYAAAAPYACVMIVASLPFTYLLFNRSMKIAGQ